MLVLSISLSLFAIMSYSQSYIPLTDWWDGNSVQLKSNLQQNLEAGQPKLHCAEPGTRETVKRLKRLLRANHIPAPAGVVHYYKHTGGISLFGWPNPVMPCHLKYRGVGSFTSWFNGFCDLHPEAKPNSSPSKTFRQSSLINPQDSWNVTYLGGRLRGERGFSLSSSFFSLASRGGLIRGLSFSSRFIRSLSHSSFRRIRSFSRSRSLSLSLSLCLRSLSRWSRSLSLSRWRSWGSRSRSRSCQNGCAKWRMCCLMAVTQ